MTVRVIEEHYGSGILKHRENRLNGKLHCLDGPAEEYYYESGALRSRIWCLNGQRHRLDGPAVEEFYENGLPCYRGWWLHDKCHRLNGPAVEMFHKGGILSGRSWCFNGFLHRLDGPAAEYFTKSGKRAAAECFLDGKLLTKAEHRRRAALLKLATQAIGSEGGIALSIIEIPCATTGANKKEDFFYHDGTLWYRRYTLDGKLHRLDGPAVQWFNESSKCIAVEFWLNSEGLTETEHRRRVALLKLAAQTLDTGGLSL